MSEWIEPTAEESAALNTLLGELEAEQKHETEGLSPHGKVVPYIGWFWREVDFTRPLRLGHCGEFVGFMENNKWDYPEWQVTEEQRREIITRLRHLAAGHVSDQTLSEFFAYLQTTQPAQARQAAEEQQEENRRTVEAHGGFSLP